MQWHLDDMGALGNLLPTHMPQATEYIDQMVAMIEQLISDGYAYAAEGHVCFLCPPTKIMGNYRDDHWMI